MHVHSLLGAGVLEPLRQLEHVELGELAGCRVLKYLAGFMVGDHGRERYPRLLASCVVLESYACRSKYSNVASGTS